MLLRLWVPLTHWLVARNWNFASCGLAFTAFRAANSTGVSPPFRGPRAVWAVVVVDIWSSSPLGTCRRCDSHAVRADRPGVWKLGRPPSPFLPHVWRAVQARGRTASDAGSRTQLLPGGTS